MRAIDLREDGDDMDHEGRGNGTVVQGDFGRHDGVEEQRDQPRNGGEASVIYVGFHSTKCPPGTMAMHARYGVCEVIWADRLERRIRYWVGEPPDYEEQQAMVPVQELIQSGI